MAILDVNTLGAVTRKTPTGFHSNLVLLLLVMDRKSYMRIHLAPLS